MTTSFTTQLCPTCRLPLLYDHDDHIENYDRVDYNNDDNDDDYDIDDDDFTNSNSNISYDTAVPNVQVAFAL